MESIWSWFAIRPSVSADRGQRLPQVGHPGVEDVLQDGRHGTLFAALALDDVDTLGRSRTGFSKKLCVPKSYVDADVQHHRDYEGTIHDIGYVVLDQEVLV
jgi:hypothetical protein